MAKLTYDEIMKLVDEKLTPELIESVIKEMGIEEDVKYYPDEHVERMHLENDLSVMVGDWLDEAIESMTLSELEERVEYFKQNQEDIREIRISRPEPEVEEEDIRVSAKDLWML